MKLGDAIALHLNWRRALGSKARTEADVLHFFLKGVDAGADCDAVTLAQVRLFLEGNGKLTQTRALKYSVLSGFFRYAIGRGYASSSPMPLREDEPRIPPSPTPYLYTRDELRRLFDAVPVSRKRGIRLDAATLRTLLLLLYGAGLRRKEALCLALCDVDLRDAVLTIRNTKFNKTRLVPIGPQLVNAVGVYAKLRVARPHPDGKDSTFLANRDGSPLALRTVNNAFKNLCCTAGIHGTDGTRQSPGLHSLRHTFAVDRLTAWYREGADVQRLLPVLSTYLGHASVAGTQPYLTMTPELLEQASLRFERYARGAENA